MEARLNYVQSNTFRYHDTFPHPDAVPYWPEIIPDYDLDLVKSMSDVGAMIVGDPDEALRQVRLWESAGADQLVLSVSLGQPKERTLKTIALMGEYVIPKVDTDPVHRTTRFRQGAG